MFSVPAAINRGKQAVVNDFIFTILIEASELRFKLPVISANNYSLTVYWGDGAVEFIGAWDQPEVVHTYATAGTYTIKIAGSATHFIFGDILNSSALRTVENMGSLGLTSLKDTFRFCSNLTSFTAGYSDISTVTTLNRTWEGCSSLISFDSNGMDTSNITNMAETLKNLTSITSIDISTWDTSSVTTMSLMFSGCTQITSINLGPVESSNLLTLNRFMYNCGQLTTFDFTVFIDTSNVTTFSEFARTCRKLDNIDLTTLRTDSATNLGSFFRDCNALSGGDVSNFIVQNVTTAGSMFSNTQWPDAEYDKMLLAWSAQAPNLQANVAFHAGTAKYTAVAERAILTDPPNSWIITDGGPV